MPEKPPYLTDDQWKEWLREQAEEAVKAETDNGKVVPLDQRRRKRKPAVQVQRPAWFSALICGDTGKPVSNVRNIMVALRGEPGFELSLAFNEMSQTVELLYPPPVVKDTEPGPKTPRPLDFDDIVRAEEWLQFNGLLRVGPEMIERAITIVAKERRYHPLRDWLNGLEWDGKPRIEYWLSMCLGTPNDEYHQRVGAMFLIGMVARIFEPGCKSDYMLVLEGPQGEEKSKFCSILAGGDEYFSEHLPKIDGDQVRLSMHLRGKWLIEVAELASMLKADPEGVKAFLTRRMEKYTPKYGRGEVAENRQCLFVGTVNQDEYISDPTGGRRFWPIVVKTIDLVALANSRGQMFAEALAKYRLSEHWWPDRQFEKTVIQPIQEYRQIEDALTERVVEAIGPVNSISLAQLGGLLGFDNVKFDMRAQKRFATILRKLGWSKHVIGGGRKIWRKTEE